MYGEKFFVAGKYVGSSISLSSCCHGILRTKLFSFCARSLYSWEGGGGIKGLFAQKLRNSQTSW